MAALDDLKSAVDTLVNNDAALKASIDAGVAKITALAAEIAANSNDATIAELAAKVSAAASDLASEKAALDAAVSPPAA